MNVNKTALGGPREATPGEVEASARDGHKLPGNATARSAPGAEPTRTADAAGSMLTGMVPRSRALFVVISKTRNRARRLEKQRDGDH